LHVEESGVARNATLTPGSLWVFPERVPYTIAPRSGGEPWHFYWFSMNPERLTFSLSAQELQVDDSFTHFRYALAALLDEYHRIAGSDEQVLSACARIMCIQLQRCFSVLKQERVDSLQHLWHAVCTDIARPWNLSALAALAHVSVSQLVRRCRQLNQCTPMQMVTRLRMLHAEQLLMRSDVNLERIAEQIGYANGFALSKAFKRQRGISPRHYREQMRE
jgi:AraC-like DNA-binding protein